APLWQQWGAVTERLDLLRNHAQQRARELDALQLGLEEIDAVSPQAQEEAQLAQEEARLAHGEALAQAAETARALLSGDADQVAGQQEPAGHQVARAAAAVAAEAHHDPRLAELADRVLEVSVQLDD